MNRRYAYTQTQTVRVWNRDGSAEEWLYRVNASNQIRANAKTIKAALAKFAGRWQEIETRQHESNPVHVPAVRTTGSPWSFLSRTSPTPVEQVPEYYLNYVEAQ